VPGRSCLGKSAWMKVVINLDLYQGSDWLKTLSEQKVALIFFMRERLNLINLN
jgi:hypothetical protein